MTGATSGIGEVTALDLARRGARIVLIARDQRRAAALLDRLSRDNPRASHAVYMADLSEPTEMRRVAAQIAAAEPRIDVLLNNAGAVFMHDARTAGGLAATFTLNHLAYFVLSVMLLPNLQAAGQARIVCTASRAHRYGRLDFDRLQINGIAGYAQSKLANILFVRELARRLAGTPVTVNAFHPGFVATRFADNNGRLWSLLARVRKAVTGLSPEAGAQTMIHLASSPDVAGRSGGYYVRCALRKPSAAARCDAQAERLWKVSVELTGVDAQPLAESPAV